MKYLILFLISFSVFANNFRVDISHIDGGKWRDQFETRGEAEAWLAKQLLKPSHAGVTFSITDQTDTEILRKDKAAAKKALKEKLKLYNCENMADGFIKDLCFERRE